MSLENQHIDFEVFRKYYTGKMNTDEKALFEKNLAKDPFAQEAYEGFLALEDDFKRISLIEKTNIQFKEKMELDATHSTFPIKATLGIAASIILLIGSIVVIQNNFNKSKSEMANNKVITQDVDDAEQEINQEKSFADSATVKDNNKEDIIEAEAPEIEAVTIEDVPKPPKDKLQTVAKDNTQASTKSNTIEKKAKEIDLYGDDAVTLEGDIIGETVEEISASPSASTQYNSLEYKDDNNIDTETSREKVLSDFKAGIVAYNQSNYNEAIIFFNKSIASNSNITSSNYYVGMSFFNLNKANKAINNFDKVIGTSSIFADDAQYYKALSLINKGQKEKAKIELQNLIKSGSSFKDAAQKKLDSL